MAPRVAAYDSLDELIQRKEYRQALSLIEKKIKKGDKSDVLQASHNTMLQAETKGLTMDNTGLQSLFTPGKCRPCTEKSGRKGTRRSPRPFSTSHEHASYTDIAGLRRIKT